MTFPLVPRVDCLCSIYKGWVQVGWGLIYNQYNCLVVRLSSASLELQCSDQLMFCLEGTFTFPIHYYVLSNFFQKCVEIFSKQMP